LVLPIFAGRAGIVYKILPWIIVPFEMASNTIAAKKDIEHTPLLSLLFTSFKQNGIDNCNNSNPRMRRIDI